MRLPRRATLGVATLGLATLGLATLMPGASLWGADAFGEANADSAASGSLAPTQVQETSPSRPAVLSMRVIGRSVNGHPIRAWELGDRGADVTAVAFGAQHGTERAGQTVLNSVRDGTPIDGIHLWVVPRVNPDGVLRGTRQNARGVDLNRNFPRHWERITGYYYSGPRPASEPETRTLMRFLTNIKPDLAVSFHSPLYGLDVSGAKNKRFARRLSEELGLPNKRLRCSGGCHGTLSQWFNHRLNGALVTVEFGPSPRDRYLHVRAPRGLVRAFGGHVRHH